MAWVYTVNNKIYQYDFAGMIIIRIKPKDVNVTKEAIKAIKNLCREFSCDIEVEQQHMYIIEKKMHTVRFSGESIIYMYKEKKNVCFVLSTGTIERERTSLKNALMNLTDSRFLCIERGFVINMSHVRKVERNSIIMDNNAVLTISRGRMKAVYDALHHFGDIIHTV